MPERDSVEHALRRDLVVELAEALRLDLHVLERDVAYIDPGRWYRPGANRVHGISRIDDLDVPERAVADNAVADAYADGVAVR